MKFSFKDQLFNAILTLITTEKEILCGTVLAIWPTFAWTGKLNKELCTFFSQLCGLKSSRNSSRLRNCRCEWTLEANPTSLHVHKPFNKPLLYSNRDGPQRRGLRLRVTLYLCTTSFTVTEQNEKP